MTTTENPSAAPARRRARPPAELTTRAERSAAGRAARAASPRSSHGAWEPSPGRPSPVETLVAQAATRVPELVPIRNGRMAVSPFTFYRGAAAIMAADLADVPRTGLTVQLCGDAHLSNFGIFAAPDRQLVFSINDFDETLPGPFEWDLKRFVASLAVAGRSNGFRREVRDEIERSAVREYREAIGTFAGMRAFDVWYTRLDVDKIKTLFGAEAGARERKTFRKATEKAESKDELRAMEKLTHVVDGQPQFISNPPIVVRLADLAGEVEGDVEGFRSTIHELVRSYALTLSHDRRFLLDRFRLADIARKVVGVGSVGTRAWVVLMLGHDDTDSLVLQVKEAERSVLEPYLGASTYKHHGQRVVEGQRLMQAASDIMLGWQRTVGVDGVPRDYFVRQLWDKKGAAVIEQMTPAGMRLYASCCGWTLARAHARSGDAVAISSYMGTSDRFDRTLAAFAESYADQNERDHAAFVQAIEDGELQAESGV